MVSSWPECLGFHNCLSAVLCWGLMSVDMWNVPPYRGSGTSQRSAWVLGSGRHVCAVVCAANAQYWVFSVASRLADVRLLSSCPVVPLCPRTLAVLPVATDMCFSVICVVVCALFSCMRGNWWQ